MKIRGDAYNDFRREVIEEFGLDPSSAADCDAADDIEIDRDGEFATRWRRIAAEIESGTSSQYDPTGKRIIKN